MFGTYERPGFGILSPENPEMRSMLYWLYDYFIKHTGNLVLDFKGFAPFYQGEYRGLTFKAPLTPCLATISKNSQRIFLVIANASSDKFIESSVKVKNFYPFLPKGLVFLDDSADSHPYINNPKEIIQTSEITQKGNSFFFVLPPKSINFITLEKNTNIL